jgi:hypothetical protein
MDVTHICDKIQKASFIIAAYIASYIVTYIVTYVIP